MKKEETKKSFKKGFIGGVGWSLGVTFGFTIVSVFLLFILSRIESVPVIGNIVGKIVESTLQYLGK